MVALALTAVVSGCQSGDGGPRCEFDTRTVLASLDRGSGAAWPKFGRDMANTARIDAVLPRIPAERWVFPERGDDDAVRDDIGPILGSALIGKSAEIYVLGRSTDPEANDVKLYELSAADGTLRNIVTPTPETPGTAETPEPTATPGPPSVAFGANVLGTPLLGDDGTLVAAFDTGIVSRFGRFGFDGDSDNHFSGALSGSIVASPNMDAEGALYVGTENGLFYRICPNLVPKFTIAAGTTRATAAVSHDGIIVFGANDSRVIAIDDEGRQLWAFFAAAPVVGAVVLNDRVTRNDGSGVRHFYFADASGAAYAGDLDTGACVWRVRGLGGAVTASPALSRDGSRLYVATEAGRIFALRAEADQPLPADPCAPSSGRILWQFPPADAPPLAPIRSSPAVATGGPNDVIVFGDDAGRVHAIEDLGAGASAYWAEPFGVDERDGGIGQSSPSIGFDGGVYIGTEGGRLYALGRAAEPGPTPTGTPGP